MGSEVSASEPGGVEAARELTSLWESHPAGPLAAPGTYQVRLLKLVSGTITPLSEEQTFEIVQWNKATIPGQDPTQVLEFRNRTKELNRRALSAQQATEEALERLSYIERALVATTTATPELWAKVRSIGLGLKDVRKRLEGDPIRARLSEPRVPGILDRLSQIVANDWDTIHGPTATHRESLAVAEEDLTSVSEELRRLLDSELRELDDTLERIGAPWTPGPRPPLL